MRTFWVVLHRYVGLAIAAFVGIAGITGSVLAYIGPLREALVDEPFQASSVGSPLSLEELDRRVRAFEPEATIEQWPLHREPGHALVFTVSLPQNTRPERRFDAVHVDAVTGAVLGTTVGNESAPIAGKILDFLYVLHTSLALPGALSQWGLWIMGAAALLWFFDCFVGAWLTFPKRPPRVSRWAPAWKVKPQRLNFDLHRAGGLWFFGMLAILALSSVQMNLNEEVFMPIARRILVLGPNPLTQSARNPSLRPDRSALTPQQAADRAIEEATRRQWQDVPERMQHHRSGGTYRIVFTTPSSEWTAAERRELYLDDRSGEVVIAFEPGRGTAADTALAWLGALHMATVLGWPYKIVLCVTGLAIGTLSVTGVVVWWRKLRGRREMVAQARRRSVAVRIGRGST